MSTSRSQPSAQLAQCILVVGNYPPDGQRSMQRFSALMAEGLSSRGLQVERLAPIAKFGALARHAGLRKWLGYVDKFILFPRVLRRRIAALESRGVSVVVHVCDHSNARYVRSLQKVPHVVTCHDLLAVRGAIGEFPGVETRWTGKQLQRDILKGLSMARYVVCDSQATRADVVRLAKLPEVRVACQYLSLDRSVWNTGGDAGPPVQAPRRYLLHVGSDAWYKNRCGVVEIYRELFSRLDNVPDLIFVGPQPSGELHSALAQCPELAGRIQFLQGLDDAALARLYRGAEALVFPSLAEGFGWPVLEAQACGCPVVASNRASLAEVGGDAAVYIPPDHPAQAAEILACVLRMDATARHSLIVRGLANACRFSAEQMIDGYLSAYQQAGRA